MEEPSHARAVSFVLAVSLVVGGWLFFEYSNHQASLRPPPVETRPPVPAPIPGPSRPAPTQVAPSPRASAPAHLTFKCEKGGRISYGDQPCGEKSTTVAVTASAPTPPTKNNLQQLQERLAVMEASRAAREQEASVRTMAASSASSPSPRDTKAVSCQAIDEAIAAVDSAARQPHSAESGDYLTAERRKLTDRRFSLAC